MTETPPLDCGPPSGVRVWLIRLDRESSQASRLSGWLSNDERDRSERFRFPQDRCRFVVCRAALRSILGAQLGIRPADIRFRYGEFGRPSLTGQAERSGPYFNVSHCRDLGCIAVAPDYDVGVDVEAVRQMNDLDQMIRKTLSAAEQRHIAAISAGERLRTFFRYWTLKEALLKVVGVGLQWPLREIETDLGNKGRIVKIPDKLAARGRFLLRELDLGEEYCGALATRSADLPRIEYRIWTYGENSVGADDPDAASVPCSRPEGS